MEAGKEVADIPLYSLCLYQILQPRWWRHRQGVDLAVDRTPNPRQQFRLMLLESLYPVQLVLPEEVQLAKESLCCSGLRLVDLHVGHWRMLHPLGSGRMLSLLH